MYPRFYKTQHKELYAFLAPDKCFHLSYNSFSRGQGFEFRIYRNRQTVLRHERHRQKTISFIEFKQLLSSVFVDHLKDIEKLLPKALLENSSMKRLG